MSSYHPNYSPLKKGDTIAIISTARFVQHAEIEVFVKDIEALGLNVILGPHLFEQHHQFAGTDEQRADALQWAIDHPDVKAIFCARGGYGSIRVAPLVNFQALKKHPKLIFGFSDVTVLHCVLNKLGIPSVHSTMPFSWPKNTKKCQQSVIDMMFGEPTELALPEHSFNKRGNIKGELIGGNLSILYSLTGTPYFPDLKGKILFIEDLDEYLYHIDRMMNNLKLNGVFDDIAALVVGGMTDMNDNRVAFGTSANEIIRDIVADYNFPVYYDAPAGHIDNNTAMLFGAQYQIENDVLKPIR